MTQQPVGPKLSHPAHPAGSSRRTLVLVASEPDVPLPTSSPVEREPAASSPVAAEPSRLGADGAGVVARRHLALVTNPFQGATE
jgi:hypothetical protein